MTKQRFDGRSMALSTLMSALFLAIAAGTVATCHRPAVRPAPLIVISGPDDFTSFELTAEGGETVWRLEAAEPTPVPALLYRNVPAGFRQVIPTNAEPRALEPGEDLLLESHIPGRRFIHRGYADSENTLAILEWAMYSTAESEWAPRP